MTALVGEPVVCTEAERASVLTETQMAGGPAFDGIKEVGGSQIAQGLDRALDIFAGAAGGIDNLW